MLYFLYLQIIFRKGDYNVYDKTIIKDKTLHIYLRLLRLSTVSFAQSRYVGNLPTQSAVHAGITVRGNASYLYRVTRDKISCYATLSGRDSDETISSGPFNGVKMFGNKNGQCIAKVYGGHRSASKSEKISTDNTYATVKFIADGNKKKEFTLYGN